MLGRVHFFSLFLGLILLSHIVSSSSYVQGPKSRTYRNGIIRYILHTGQDPFTDPHTRAQFFRELSVAKLGRLLSSPIGLRYIEITSNSIQILCSGNDPLIFKICKRLLSEKLIRRIEFKYFTETAIRNWPCRRFFKQIIEVQVRAKSFNVREFHEYLFKYFPETLVKNVIAPYYYLFAPYMLQPLKKCNDLRVYETIGDLMFPAHGINSMQAKDLLARSLFLHLAVAISSSHSYSTVYQYFKSIKQSFHSELLNSRLAEYGITYDHGSCALAHGMLQNILRLLFDTTQLHAGFYDSLSVEDQVLFRATMYFAIISKHEGEEALLLEMITSFVQGVEQMQMSRAEVDFLVYCCIEHDQIDLPLLAIIKSPDTFISRSFMSNSDAKRGEWLSERHPASKIILFATLFSSPSEYFPANDSERNICSLWACPELAESFFYQKVHDEMYLIEATRRHSTEVDADGQVSDTVLKKRGIGQVSDICTDSQKLSNDCESGARHFTLKAALNDHFMSLQVLHELSLPCVNGITHTPAGAAAVDTRYNLAERTRSKFEEFIFPALSRKMLNGLIDHFRAHKNDPDYGEDSWNRAHRNDKEYALFENDLFAFVEKGFSMLGWLARSPYHQVAVYYAPIESVGQGLLKEVLNDLSEIIFLPRMQLFRFVTDLDGFIPVPLLHPAYMALIGELHSRMTKMQCSFEWRLIPAYNRFLYYEEDIFQKMDDLVAQIYAADVKNLAALSGVEEGLGFYYPLTLMTHVPVSLDFPNILEKKPFMFSDPGGAKELLKKHQPAWGKFEEPSEISEGFADRPVRNGWTAALDRDVRWRPAQRTFGSRAARVDAAAYERFMIAQLRKHLVLGRLAYVSHFFKRISRRYWEMLDSVTWSRYAKEVAASEFSYEAMRPAIIFNDPKPMEDLNEPGVVDDVEVEESKGEYPVLTAREAFDRVLRAMRAEDLCNFYWFCTTARRPPIGGFEVTPIQVDAVYPSPTQPLQWPTAHTCWRSFYWVIYPSLSENQYVITQACANTEHINVDEQGI